MIRLITSLMDHGLAPASELAALYRHCWEFELTLEEVETHQMPHHRLLATALARRSRGLATAADLGARCDKATVEARWSTCKRFFRYAEDLGDR